MKYFCYLNTDKEGNPSAKTKKVLETLLVGQDVDYVTYDRGFINEGTLVLRSRSPEANNIIRQCWRIGQPFVYVDTGYFNEAGIKTYHRVTLNHFQRFDVIDRPDDRWRMFQSKGVTDVPWRTGGNKIIVCPPTEKSLGAYDWTSNDWTTITVNQLSKTHPDKEIVLRTKPKPEERRQGDSLQNALADPSVYAVASCHGGVAIEAALMGVPSYVHAHNAAQSIAQTDFSLDVIRPDKTKWLHSISYDQFDLTEFESGLALKSVL